MYYFNEIISWFKTSYRIIRKK